MAVIPLRAAHLKLLGVIAEHLTDRGRLDRIVERRGAAVRVDVRDVARRHVTVGEREPHRARGLRRVRPRGRHVMRVVRVPEPHDFGVDVRAASSGALVLLEHHHGAALSHHETVTAAIEGA